MKDEPLVSVVVPTFNSERFLERCLESVRGLDIMVGRIKVVIKHNEGRLILQDAMLKKRYYGKTLKRYRMKHPDEANGQLALIRPAFLRNWRKLMADPTHAVGMLIMKTCEYLSTSL